MKFTKKFSVSTILFLIIVLILCGCTGKETQKESDFLHEIAKNQTKDSSLYTGDLPTADYDAVEIIQISITEDSCIFQNYNYTNISSKVKTYFITGNWGWRIDLSSLELMGKTDTDQLVYAQKDTNNKILSLIICDEENNLTWYYDEESAVFDPKEYSFEDFLVVEYPEKKIDHRNSPENIWRAHSILQEGGEEGMFLDGDFELYLMTLTNKSHPELSYLLYYGYYVGDLHGLYIYNLSNDSFMLFPEK